MDNLTRLYNKDSARKRIERHLARRYEEETCALFIIDLDNFKLVNDRYGHMFGDAVLSKISTQLSRMFRSEDIVSRIGGDEFMALLKGSLSHEHIELLADRIIAGFQKTFEVLPPECHISCSIGIAICPKDGSDFQTLFQRADIALYRAKAEGKKQYRFFGSQMDRLAFGLTDKRPPVSQEHDTNPDQTAGEVDLKDLISVAFRTLNEAENVDKAVNSILEAVGRRMNVGRAYVFERAEYSGYYSNTFEWCNEGIESEIEKLQNFSHNDCREDYSSFFDEKGILYCSDISKFPPDLFELIDSQGIKSLLQCAIRDEGEFKGWVGFDDCTDHHLWTGAEIEILSFIAELLSLFLLKKRAQKQATDLAEDLLTVLDHQNSWLYVTDPDTYELLFINAKILASTGSVSVGMRCYEAFLNAAQPCERCPMKDIKQTVSNSLEIYNPRLDIWTLADASLIRWENKPACLLACHDITPYKGQK